MSEIIRDILFVYPNWIIFLPLVLAIKYRKQHPPEFNYIFLYLVLSVLTQLTSFVLWKMSRNNYPILHVYTLLEYFLLLKFYSEILKGFMPRIVFILLLFVFLLFSVLDSLLIENIFTFNTYSRSIEALIFMTLAISWFIKIVGETDDERQKMQGVIYFNCGFFIYFTGSVILFSYSSYIDQMILNSRLNVWTIHTFLIAQVYILISIGLWRARTR